MVVVVTGGIGSGKSQVCRILCDRFSMLLYDADSKVKEIYFRRPEIVRQLERMLDCTLTDEMGTFVPSRLAARIFGKSEAVEEVERIVFPELLMDFASFCRSNPGKDVVFESATILEKPMFDDFGDLILLVDAPFDVRLKRACMRDNVSEETVLARMSNQKMMNAISDNGISESVRPVDALIMNTGTLDELEAEVLDVMSRITDKMNMLNK